MSEEGPHTHRAGSHLILWALLDTYELPPTLFMAPPPTLPTQLVCLCLLT